MPNKTLAVTVTITCDDQANAVYSATYAEDTSGTTAGGATVASDGTINLSSVNQGVDITWNLVPDPGQEMTYQFQQDSETNAIVITPLDTEVFSPDTVNGNSASMVDTNEPVQFEYTLNCKDMDSAAPGAGTFSLDPRVVNR